MKRRMLFLGVLAAAIFFGCNKSPTSANDPTPPNPPSTPTPASGQTDEIAFSEQLSWYSHDSNPADSLRYTVYFDSVNPPKKQIAHDLSASSVTVKSLALGKTYYWQVVVTDGISSVPGDVWNFVTYKCMTTTAMKLIPAGTYLMGDTSTIVLSTLGDAGPAHLVTLSSFRIDSTDVTQGDYASLLGQDPSTLFATREPVEHETWFDAVLYCNARSRYFGYDTVYSYTSITGTPGNGCTNLGNLTIDYAKNGYRLPTEAEWEYACRAGTTTDFYWGTNYPPMNLNDSTLYAENVMCNFVSSDILGGLVATLAPNKWGLYDMEGNVYQWCNDWYDAYDSTAQTNPQGPSTSPTSTRLTRGVGREYYTDIFIYAVSAARTPFSPVTQVDNLGFRCVQSVQ